MRSSLRTLSFLLFIVFVGSFQAWAQDACLPADPNFDIINPIHDEDCTVVAGNCTSKDLELVGARLDVDQTCNSCDSGEEVIATLYLSINNTTGSTRTSFAVFGNITTTDPMGVVEVCSLSRCSGEIPPNQITELPYGMISFTCGDELKLTDLFLSWTDASPNSTCQNHDCQEVAPKCGTLDEIIIAPPLQSAVTAECNGSVVDVDLTVQGGTPPFTYAWTGPNNFMASTEDLIGVDPETTYSVIVTDNDQCTTEAQITTPVCFTCPVLSNETADFETCEDDQGQFLSVEASSADADIEFFIFNTQQGDPYAGGGTQLGSAVTPTGVPLTATSTVGITGLAPGTYYAYAVVDLADPDVIADPTCRPFAEIVITIEALADPGTNGTLTICEGEIVTEAELFASLGGTPDAGGVWTPALAGAGTYTYTFAATTNCPEVSADVVVDEQTALDPGTDGTLTICAGETVTAQELFDSLGGTPDAGGVWTPALAGAGTYTYTHAAVGECPEVSADVVVDEQTALDPGTDGTLTICAGETVTAQELFDSLGGTPDAGGVWTPALAGAGTYTYTHAAVGECPEVSADVVVDEQTALDPGTDGTLTICAGETVTAQELFDSLGGTPDAGGVWTPALAGAGTYTYTHAAVGECPEVSADVVVDEQTALDPGTDGTLTICAGETVTAQELFDSLGGTPDAGGVWTPALAGAGTYTYTHAAVGECPEVSADVVVDEQTALDPGTDGTLTICAGETVTAQELFDSLGGTPDAGGVWTPALAGAGTYTYTHAAVGECPEVSADVVVDEQTALDPGTDGTLTICAGETVTAQELFDSLGGTPDAGGVWTPALAGAGTYTYTHAAVGECPEVSADVVVDEQTALDPGTDGTLTICAGETVTAQELFDSLGGTPDAGGVWTPALAGAGTYTYTHAAVGECPEVSADVVVDEQTALDPGTDGTLTICAGETVTAQELFDSLGGTPDAGGVWTPALAGAGTYTYTHAAVGECPEVSADVVVDEQTALDPGTDGTLTICIGETVTAQELFDSLGGTPDAGGVWTPALAGAGTYTYTHAAVGECPEVSADVVVDEQTALDPGTDGTLTICAGETVTAQELFDSLGGTPDAGGVWTPALAGAGTYTYTHAAVGECPEVSADVVVDEQTALDPGTDGTLTICIGETVTAQELFDSLGGTPDAGGVWTPALAGAGTYTYTHAAVGECPEVSADVVVDEQTALDPGTDGTLTICIGETVTAQELFDSLGGTPDAGGVWTPALAGAGTYTYTHAAVGECPEVSADVVVDEQTALDPGTDGTLTICAGETVTAQELFDSLGGTPDAGGVWTPALAGAGTYTYTHAAVGECPEVSAEVMVDETPNPDAGDDADLLVCESTVVDLYNLVTVPGGTYSETVPSGALNGNIFDTTGLAAGVYEIIYTVTSQLCGDDTALITIEVEAQTVLNVCTSENVDFCGNVGGPYNFYWPAAKQTLGTVLFSSTDQDPLVFTEYPDGTALIEGNTLQGNCTVSLHIKLVDRKNWAEWSADGGSFKNQGCSQVDNTLLRYYVIDEENSFATISGPDCPDEGMFVISQRPDPDDQNTPNLGVHVGPGGALYDTNVGAEGIAGWGWMGDENNPQRWIMDFNFLLDCMEEPICEIPLLCEITDSEDVSCVGGNDGSATVTPSGGTTPYAYLWESPDHQGFQANSQSVSGLAAGYYVVTVWDALQNKTQCMVKIDAPEPPYAGEDGMLSICPGEDVSEMELFDALGGNPDAGGVWSPAFNGPGIYTYTVGEEPCDPDTATVEVKEEAEPFAGDDGALTICEGETVTENQLFAALGGSSDQGGSWSPALAGQGTYTYTVGGGNCPSDSAEVQVTEEPARDPGMNGELYICVGETVTEQELFNALGGTPESGGTWSPLPDGVQIYTYTLPSTQFCPEVSAQVTVIGEPGPDAGEDGMLAICEGGTVTEMDLFNALGGMPDMGGTWSPMPLAGQGTYTYTIDATNICSGDTAEVVVTEDVNLITYYADLDADGFGNPNNSVTTCDGAPAGFVEDNTDCDDSESAINPGALEICDGVDNNCDGMIDEGFDMDQDGWTICQGDCDDTDDSIFPGAVEVCDEVDNNCDGMIDEGFDMDQDGWTICAGDCDDTDPSIFPGAEEICDGVDNDCDGEVDEDGNILVYVDFDGDSYGDANDPGQLVCEVPQGFVEDNSDCDDTDSAVNPGAEEICDDGLDNNCDGEVDNIDLCDLPSKSLPIVTDLKVYHVPFTNSMGMDLDIPYDAQLKLEFMDMSGKRVLVDEVGQLKAGFHNLNCNIMSLPTEVYLLRVHTGRELLLRKVYFIK